MAQRLPKGQQDALVSGRGDSFYSDTAIPGLVVRNTFIDVLPPLPETLLRVRSRSLPAPFVAVVADNAELVGLRRSDGASSIDSVDDLPVVDASTSLPPSSPPKLVGPHRSDGASSSDSVDDLPAVDASTSSLPPKVFEVVDHGAKRTVFWRVPGKLLKSKDTKTASQNFGLTGEGPFSNLRFLLMLFPGIPRDASGRGAGGFRKADGRGFILLKCEDELHGSSLRVSYTMALCRGEEEVGDVRGPHEHDFVRGATCGLPADHDIWEFSTGIDPSSKRFTVRLDLELLSTRASAS